MEKEYIMISELNYQEKPKNEKYYSIALENDERKRQENQKLWDKIENNGEYIKTNYTMDFLVFTYKFDNKFYELWYNDNHGYVDCVKEYII